MYTSIPIYLRDSEILCFLYGIYIFSPYVNFISIDQELIHSIHFQFVIFLDLPDDIVYNEVEKQ